MVELAESGRYYLPGTDPLEVLYQEEEAERRLYAERRHYMNCWNRIHVNR